MIYNNLNLIRSVFIALLVMTLVSSCKTTKDVVNNKVENYHLEDALLWQIDGNGLQEPSYLYGTIHMIDKESFYYPAGVLTAFEDAEKVAFEVDLDDMFDMSKAMGMMTKAFMADGKTLKDLYSAEDYAVVNGHFQELGLPMMILEKLKPMFLTVFATGDVDISGGFGGAESSTKSYEMELYALAQEAKKDVEGLETIEYQLSVFDSIPLEYQAEMLLETIKTSDTEDDSFKEMVDMYVNQNINDMITFMSEEEEGIAGFEDVLLYTRNKNWIPVISEKMAANQYFFAVGAGHLAGKDGVIDLLKKAGYKLTPLSQVK